MYFDTCFLFLKNRKRLFWKFTFSIHIPTETLCDLLRMILTMNNCTFNQQHYLQIHGTAMGTKMAPSFANLFLCMFELHALTNAAWQPHIWWRYIDDISWSGQKVQIVRKYSAIISITFIPLLSLLALTHFNTNDLAFRCRQNCATCPCITNGLKSYTFFLQVKHAPSLLTLLVTLRTLTTWFDVIVVRRL